VLRGYYEPAWVVLRELATLPFELVAILRFLADERAAGYLQVDQLNRTLNKIPWVRLEGEDMYMYEPSEKFRDLVLQL
jgi:hypothetical protein